MYEPPMIEILFICNEGMLCVSDFSAPKFEMDSEVEL